MVIIIYEPAARLLSPSANPFIPLVLVGIRWHFGDGFGAGAASFWPSSNRSWRAWGFFSA